MEFSRPKYWSGYPFPSPGDLPGPGTKHRSPALQVDSLQAESQGKPKSTGMGSLSLSRGSSNPGMDPGSPGLQVDSLPTVVGSPTTVEVAKICQWPIFLF